MITGPNPVLDSFRQDVGETRLNLVERLQKFLPASIMLPPKRLRSLLAKVNFNNSISLIAYSSKK